MKNYTPSAEVSALLARAKPYAARDQVVAVLVGAILRLHQARAITVMANGVPEVQQAPLSEEHVALVCNDLTTELRRHDLRTKLRAEHAAGKSP